MKNYKVFVGTILTLLGVLLLSGCPDILNSPAKNNAGELVTISINATGRTLLPSAPTFDKYLLTFTANAGQTAPQVNPVELENNSHTLTLEPGSWTVSVIGMVWMENIPGIEDGYYEAASGSADFTVGAGASNSVAVTVRGGIQEGVQGTFSWDISFPDEVIAGTLEILDIDEQPIEDIGPFGLMGEENRTGTLALNPGYYLLKVELENGDGNKAYRAEIFHIYSNLTTTAGDGNGYAFTAASFAPMVTLNGQVLCSEIDNVIPSGTVSLYRDNAFTQLIDETAFDEDGAWSFRISTYYNNVYLKAVVEYSGFELPIERTKGPIAVTSTNPEDWTIDAQLLYLTGMVLLDSVVETEEAPIISLYSDAQFDADTLITTVNVNTDNGAWAAIISPVYTTVYLQAVVEYTNFEAFERTKGPVSVDSTDINDWTIDARLLHLTGTVQLDTGVTTTETPTLSLYEDAEYDNLIKTVDVENDGTWSMILLPNYTNVYLRTAVEYDGFDPFTKDKGPVSVTSNNSADWTIDARLLCLEGVFTLYNDVPIITAALSLYSDSDYSILITVADVDTVNSTWTGIIIPEYTTVYMKATAEYSGIDTFERTKGPVTVTSNNITDWTIDMGLITLNGTLTLSLSDELPAMPDFTVKIYNDGEFTNAIQNNGTDLVAPINIDGTNGSFSLIIPISVFDLYQTVYFKVYVSSSEAFETAGGNISDYTVTGGTGLLTGVTTSGSKSVTISTYSVSGFCNLTIAPINDDYGDQSNYGNTSISSAGQTNNGKVKGSVTVTAAENSGYVFVKWVASNDRTAEALSKEKNYTFTILADMEIFAVFNANGTTTTAPIEIWEAGTISNNAYITDSTDTAVSGTFNGIRNGLNLNYKLVKDITITGTWTPIGSNSTRFTGTLEGNKKTINFISGSSIITVNYYGGIFSHISGVVIQNLTVAGAVDINSPDKILGAGAIVGYFVNGTIQQCAVTASITANSPNYPNYNEDGGVGGIAGYAYSGTITASYVSGNVSASNGDGYQTVCVGGIAGAVNLCNIRHCYTTGRVSGGRYNETLDVYAGGIVGLSHYGTIEYCYTRGNVTGGTSGFAGWAGIAGGIVGVNDNIIRYCVALNDNVSNGANRSRRIVQNNKGTLSNNYGRDGMGGVRSPVEDNANGLDGASVDFNSTTVQTWWFGNGGIFNSYEGSSVTQPWVWNASLQRPTFYWQE